MATETRNTIEFEMLEAMNTLAKARILRRVGRIQESFDMDRKADRYLKLRLRSAYGQRRYDGLTAVWECSDVTHPLELEEWVNVLTDEAVWSIRGWEF